MSYTLGFLGVYFWLRRNRLTMGMDMHAVYSLTIVLAIGVLVGGRAVEVFFYEWDYYGSHLLHIPALWLGGMSTHGILLGGIIAIILFCRIYRRSFFEIADVLAIAAAYIMGVGRIGNFIDGQIVGSVTDVWWAVKFPDLDGFRHPVVLYDGIKNLLLIPFLLLIRKAKPPRGALTAHFILWYGFLRIFVDFFREYRTDFFGFPPGQEFNILMTIVGSSLLAWFYYKRAYTIQRSAYTHSYIRLRKRHDRMWFKRGIFAVLLLVPVLIPSDWTQDVPSRYGKRHPGLSYSTLYPKIDIAGETNTSTQLE